MRYGGQIAHWYPYHRKENEGVSLCTDILWIIARTEYCLTFYCKVEVQEEAVMEIILSISFGLLYVVTGIVYFFFTKRGKDDDKK